MSSTTDSSLPFDATPQSRIILRMVTYVLGAGASHHAGYPLTTNLGNCLTEWVCQNWTDDFFWKNYIVTLHESYGGLANLEVALTELYEKPAGSRAESLGKFFCGHAIGALGVAIPEFFNSLRRNPVAGLDLYEKLASEQVRNGDTIITLNYDLALERALKKERLWEIGDGYGFSLGR